MYKMYKKGMGGGFINFFVICTLTQCNTMYSCKNNNILSEPFRANWGVKQGDSLSPTSFILYADDFLEYF